MKSTALALFALLAVASRQASADCLNQGLLFERLTSCTYESLLAAYTVKFNEPTITCAGTTAEQDLWLKLGPATSLSEAQAYVTTKICPFAYDSRAYIPFYKAANKGTDYEFEKRYFDGKAIWNEQVETLYGPNGVGSSSYNLQDDSRAVQTFQNGAGSTEQVEFPTTLSNFANCASNVAYCCFVTDRQANDGNGNCQSPYDSQCVDKDPGDNTDLCYVDHSRGTASSKVNSTGENIFSKDDDNNSDNAEGPIHCHGIAWANDKYDSSSRYKGNNQFFVSMFDHMNQRGYVRPVPGAPMCACAEQMPVVSRADCTEVTPKETFKIYYSADKQWGANLTSIALTFAACKGINNNNNNLEAYAQRLYYEKKLNSTQMALLSKSIVGNNNCNFAAAAYLQAKGYPTGYQETSSTTGMTQIAGKGLHEMNGNTALSSKGNAGDATFIDLYRSSPTGIILRLCSDCDNSQRKIYVRFNPGYSPNSPNSTAPWFYWVKGNVFTTAAEIGQYGVAWAMYSTYSDALSRTNAWSCPNYNYGTFFPGDCDPVQGTKTDQWARFEPYFDGRRDAAWYIDASNPFVALDQRTFGGSPNFTSVDLWPFDTSMRGGFDIMPNGTMYIRGGGWDIWSQTDYCHLAANLVSAVDATLTMRIKSFVSMIPNYVWARVCLAFRRNATANSAGFEGCLTSGNDFLNQWRTTENGWKDGNVYMWDGTSKVKSGYVTIVKKGDSYSMYVSYDGINWKQQGNTQFLPGMLNGTFYAGIMIDSQSSNIAEAVIEGYQFIKGPSRMACGIVPDV